MYIRSRLVYIVEEMVNITLPVLASYGSVALRLRRQHGSLCLCGMLGTSTSEPKLAVWVVCLHVAPEGLLAGQLRVDVQVEVLQSFHLPQFSGDWA